MTKPLIETVKDIIYLLSVNGNTKEYQLRKKLLNSEEQLVLNKLKQQKARNIHKIFKESKMTSLDMISLDGSTSSDSSRHSRSECCVPASLARGPRSLTQFYNISDVDDDVIIEPNTEIISKIQKEDIDDNVTSETFLNSKIDEKQDGNNNEEEIKKENELRKKRNWNKKQRRKQRLEQQKINNK